VGIEFIGRSAMRNEVREFQHSSGKRAPYTVNAIFDWVRGENSVGRPRRKIVLHKPATVNSQGKRTKAFNTWVYTDDKGNLEDPQSEGVRDILAKFAITGAHDELWKFSRTVGVDDDTDE
jgi:hypothetical protein